MLAFQPLESRTLLKPSHYSGNGAASPPKAPESSGFHHRRRYVPGVASCKGELDTINGRAGNYF